MILYAQLNSGGMTYLDIRGNRQKELKRGRHILLLDIKLCSILSLQLPPVKERDIPPLVARELPSHYPHSLEEYSWDFQRQGEETRVFLIKEEHLNQIRHDLGSKTRLHSTAQMVPAPAVEGVYSLETPMGEDLFFHRGNALDHAIHLGDQERDLSQELIRDFQSSLIQNKLGQKAGFSPEEQQPPSINEAGFSTMGQQDPSTHETHFQNQRDILHPRAEKLSVTTHVPSLFPPPKSNAPRALVAALVSLVLLGLLFGLPLRKRNRLERELEILDSRIEQLEQQNQSTTENEVDWQGALTRLESQIPPDPYGLLDRLMPHFQNRVKILRLTQRDWEITMEGRCRDALGLMEEVKGGEIFEELHLHQIERRDGWEYFTISGRLK